MAFARRGGYGAVMIGIRRYVLGALAAAALAAISPVQAAEPKKNSAAAAAPKTAAHSLGTFGSWAAYASRDAIGQVCYLVGQPHKSEPAGFTRKAPTAMVTHRPVEKIANVVSFVEGYPLKEGSEVALDIGGTKFALFTKDDSAWARTAELDKSIVAALAQEQAMTWRIYTPKSKRIESTTLHRNRIPGESRDPPIRRRSC